MKNEMVEKPQKYSHMKPLRGVLIISVNQTLRKSM